MKNLNRATLVLATLLLAGCGGGNDDKAAEAAKANEAQHAQTQDALAKGLGDMKKAVDSSAAKMQDQLSAELAKQKETLVAQFQSSNQDLRSQYAGLESKIESLKAAIPAEAIKAIQEKLPLIEKSIGQLEQLVSKFSPQTIEQVNAFKTQYASELKVAQDLLKQALSLLEKSNVKLPAL